jgi:exosome complex component CSL4
MKQTIIPGETITTEEEFLAGKNTYVEDGLIKASSFGNVNLDNATKKASVQGKCVETISEGAIVYGVVTNVKDTTIMIELRRGEGEVRITTKNAQIPVRNISNEFVSRTRDYYRIGDIVKAKVAKISEYGIDLETKGKDLGVVKAYCSKCRHEMTPGQGKLRCLNCASVEGRKWFENEDEYKPRERDDSRGFGGRGRDNRGYSSDRRHSGGFRSGGRDNNHRSYGGDRHNSRPHSGERRPYNSNRQNNSGGRNNETRNH